MKNLTKKLIVAMAMMALALVALPTQDASAATSKCFNSGKLCYQITGNNTCTVKGLSKKGANSTACTIPSKVTCNGKTYKVTAIAEKAFCNNDKLTSVKCPNSIKTIGNKAFYDCDSLSNVVIGNNCNSVKNNAFGSCNSLKKVNCGTTIKNLGSNCFGNATCKVVRK